MTHAFFKSIIFSGLCPKIESESVHFGKVGKNQKQLTQISKAWVIVLRITIQLLGAKQKFQSLTDQTKIYAEKL